MAFIQGYQSKYYSAKIFPTETECLEYDRHWERVQGMYVLFESLVKWPQPNEIAEFIIHNYDGIKKIMEE